MQNKGMITQALYPHRWDRSHQAGNPAHDATQSHLGGKLRIFFLDVKHFIL